MKIKRYWTQLTSPMYLNAQITLKKVIPIRKSNFLYQKRYKAHLKIFEIRRQKESKDHNEGWVVMYLSKNGKRRSMI